MTREVSVAGAHAQLRALCANPFPWPETSEPGGLRAGHRDAAVLLLFGVLDPVPARTKEAVVARELDVLLMRRADTLRSHPGQMSFPGGRVDPDDDGVVGAALREAHEETGLDPAGVEVLGTLPPVPLAVSRHLVAPVVGWWARPTPVRAVDPGESAEVFRVPVADLLDPRHRGSVRFTTPAGVRVTPAFVVGRHVVWGFTALVLDRLFDVLGWSVPWDASRTLRLEGGRST